MNPRLVPGDYIRRIDVFDHFAPSFVQAALAAGEPHVQQLGWENRSEDEHIPPATDQPYNADFCRAACASRSGCWAWQIGRDDEGARCMLSTRLLRIGNPREGFTAGWMLDRFARMREAQPCHGRPFLS
jgi:hypothetical protein